jgi:hypothetical protein
MGRRRLDNVSALLNSLNYAKLNRTPDVAEQRISILEDPITLGVWIFALAK